MTTKTKTTKTAKTTKTGTKTSRAARANETAAAPQPPPPAQPRVRFACQHAGASAVFLAGTFNQWHPTATPMQPAGEGRWTAELELAPGVYEYRFVVDGVWLHDPTAESNVPNPFGGLNSVLTVNAS
jgi:1,4-alpha-glucan branching enzyme